LSRFTALVGPNGAGKSNFVEALAFLQECLGDSIELAFKNRGGIGAVRRRSGGHPTHVGLRVVVDLSDAMTADYSFEIAARSQEQFRVARERCVVSQLFGPAHSFLVKDGEFQQPIPGLRPRVAPDRLALFAASATEEFRGVFDFLTRIRTYSIVPERLRQLQDPDAGLLLTRNGSNAAAVLKRLRDEDSDEYERTCSLLSRVVQGVQMVEYRSVGQKETLQFRQDVGLKDPWTFQALNMSDGTLRVLGVLLAVYQPTSPSFVAIEEPEATIHPAAAELLTSVLIDASADRQILITTHSPDILDVKQLREDDIRVVTKEGGQTLVTVVAEAARESIRRRLYSPGELLRGEELQPDTEIAREVSGQLNLFGAPQTPHHSSTEGDDIQF
jgi:predicted ATPase